MMTRLLVSIAGCVAVAGLVACGGDDDSGDATAPAASGSTAAPGKAAVSPTSGGSTSAAAKLPTDGCALLTLAEAKQLSALMTAGKPGGPASGPNQAVSCRWEWEDLTKGISFGTLNVEVQTLPAGESAASIKPFLQAELRDAKENGAEISGAGDYAIYSSTIPANAETKGVVKGLLVVVDYSRADARAQKEAIIALFKLVANRIQ
jgi:hypothetical protein